jgi:predicted RNA-binding protein with PUA-like domain
VYQTPFPTNDDDLIPIPSSHPYYDPKTKKEEPTWFMVSVKFLSRLQYPPSLALVKYLASCFTVPDQVAYIGKNGFEAVKNMQLVNRGRLSEFSFYGRS